MYIQIFSISSTVLGSFEFRIIKEYDNKAQSFASAEVQMLLCDRHRLKKKKRLTMSQSAFHWQASFIKSLDRQTDCWNSIGRHADYAG